MARTAKIEQDIRTVAQLPQPEEYQKARVSVLDGGINVSKTGEAIALNESPKITNLTLVNGQLQVDKGYAPFATAYVGLAQLTFQTFYADGTDELLLVTTNSMYRYVVAVQQWQYVSYAVAYSITGLGTAAGGTVFALNSVAGMAIGELIGIGLDNGSQLQTTITNIAGLNITTLDPVPVGRTAPGGATVALAPGMHGTTAIQVVVSPFPSNGWTIISNGIDPVLYYVSGVLAPLPGLPLNTTCQAMVVFHEQLFIANTIENGTSFPQRVRRSDQADATNWSTGLAGIDDLVDTEDFILSLLILGPWLIAYRETTIMRCSYLGLPNQTVFWEYMVYGEGAVSQNAVAELGGQHLVVGNQGIYKYKGGYDLETISENIYTIFFSAIQGELHARAKSTLFTQYIGDYDEVWIVYPKEPSLLPNKMIRVVLEQNAWYEREFANSFLSASPYLPLADTTWATAVGTWASNTLPWNSRIFNQNVPNILLSPGDLTVIEAFDYSTAQDGGQVISWEMQTKDIGEGDYELRWDSVRIFGKGQGLLSFSEDSGDTWTLIDGIFLGDTRNDLDVVGLSTVPVSQYLRFKITGDDPTFSFVYLELWYLRESEW
jgi:hypothetical protein